MGMIPQLPRRLLTRVPLIRCLAATVFLNVMEASICAICMKNEAKEGEKEHQVEPRQVRNSAHVVLMIQTRGKS